MLDGFFGAVLIELQVLRSAATPRGSPRGIEVKILSGVCDEGGRRGGFGQTINCIFISGAVGAGVVAWSRFVSQTFTIIVPSSSVWRGFPVYAAWNGT